MTLSYDIEKIRKIIDDLHEITGLSLGFMDTDFKYIYKSLNENDEYCNMINSTDEGKKRCLCSDIDMTKRCAEALQPVSHICHAGVLDTTVPIMKNGILSGFIIIGRIRRDSTEGIRRMIEWLGKDTDRVIPHYNELSHFSKKQLESLIDIISNIIFESAIVIKHNNIADAARTYIERNIQSKLSIGELCSALYTTKNRLYSDFHAAFGMTVNEYVTERRIEKAKELLYNTDMTVSEISAAVGIENPPYFSELFKKRCNMTPREYREKGGKASDPES